MSMNLSDCQAVVEHIYEDGYKNSIASNGATRLYLMGCSNPVGGESYFKIGITNSLGSRLASIQTGNPFKVSVLLALDFQDRSDALLLEKTFHEQNNDIRMEGEWFATDLVDCHNRLLDAAEFLGMDTPPRDHLEKIINGEAG